MSHLAHSPSVRTVARVELFRFQTFHSIVQTRGRRGDRFNELVALSRPSAAPSDVDIFQSEIADPLPWWCLLPANSQRRVQSRGQKCITLAQFAGSDAGDPQARFNGQFGLLQELRLEERAERQAESAWQEFGRAFFGMRRARELQFTGYLEILRAKPFESLPAFLRSIISHRP